MIGDAETIAMATDMIRIGGGMDGATGNAHCNLK